MGIQDIKFTGLIQNRDLSSITGPEFFNALYACGWKEGIGTHFLQQLRKDGPTRGIYTPAQLERAIARGTSEPGRDGKTIHWVCNHSAYIVYNDATRTLITFSQGRPSEGKSSRWDVSRALQYLRSKTKPPPPYGYHKCATLVEEAIAVGGLAIVKFGSGKAKDFGPRLIRAGFVAVLGTGRPYKKGDVAVIDGFTDSAAPEHNSPYGHMAMFDGSIWISDYQQPGDTPYPGSHYEKAKPKITIYRVPE